MMQNDDLEVINMVNKNHEKQKQYKLQKEESKKMKEVKSLKKIKGTIIKSVAGIIVVSSIISYAHINNNNEILEEPNITIVTQTNNQNNINIEQTKSIENVNVVEENTEQKLLKKYCNEVYNVNYDVAYNIASKLTDDFTSSEYLQTNNPSFKINKKNADTKEQGIILFLRHLYQKPQDFGLNNSDIINNNFEPNNKGDEELKVKYYSNLFGVDPILVLAIQYHEASRYSSDAYIKHNNPAGLMIEKNKLWHFNSPDEGIIEHIYQLKKKYIDKGYTTPKEIKKQYAPDNAENDPYDLNKYWLSSVESIMEEIKNDSSIFDKNVKSR